jgi:hypothetical protein
LSWSGWLFDASESGSHPALDEQQLGRSVSALLDTAVTCAALGISYIPAIIPAKRHAIGLGSADERAGISALGARLLDVDEVELIDLLPVLRQAARHGSPYHRTDADWNDRGAFFVARALLKEAHKRIPSLRPPPISDLRLRAVPEHRGTLANAPKFELVAGDLEPRELVVAPEVGAVIDAHTQRSLRMPVEAHLAQAGSVHLRVYANPHFPNDARLAVVGDAAGLPLALWLAERAHRTTFFWARELPLLQLELELPPILFHLIREADLFDGTTESAAGEEDRLEDSAELPVREPERHVTPAHP